jgi:predicted hotdog family 3-hydroxylacyl-ACP dehydratase
MSVPRLADLVPHRAPMLLLDELIASDDTSATCAVTISGTSMFIEAGRVPAWVALEYCAQCVAVFAGLQAHKRGDPPRLGLLVSAREMTLETDGFSPGDRLIVHVRHEFGEVRVGRFDCTVTRAELPVAKVSLSVYQPEQRDVGGDAGEG